MKSTTDFHELFEKAFKTSSHTERSDAFAYMFGVFGGHFRNNSSMSKKEVYEALEDAFDLMKGGKE